MTFGDARTILRNDVLAETSTDYYSDGDLLGFLVRSAKELALSFGFPTDVATVALLAGATSFSLPADAENIDLNEVSFEGLPLQLVPYRTIQEYQEQTSVGLPRYYNFEPKRGGTVLIAPKTLVAGDVAFEYVKTYDTGAITEADDIWDGLFPAFHELVVWQAATRAFDASLETERAGYASQRAGSMAQALSLYLNKTPANRVLVPEVAES